MKRPLGIYIHVPFCLKKCLYCDFCSYVGADDTLRGRYVDALCRHISQYRELCSDREVDTVYFGGGTPTLLSPDQFAKVFSALHESFTVSPDAEMTVECNPATADLEKLRALRRLGVNRLSIGVQSANDGELASLGRVHSFADARAVFSDAREAGFDNVSVDVMFGIPHQTRESFGRSLEEILSLSPDHVSAYGLILEEGTPFYANSENLVLPDEDTEYNMYECISVGKIYDIFAGKSFTEWHYTHSNSEGMSVCSEIAQKDFCGLCFVNLVDFDMLWGHRRDAVSYAEGLNAFDAWLCGFTEKLCESDMLIITADHGCDPSFCATTDHTREYTPLIVYKKGQDARDLGTLDGFDNIACIVSDELLIN